MPLNRRASRSVERREHDQIHVVRGILGIRGEGRVHGGRRKPCIAQSRINQSRAVSALDHGEEALPYHSNVSRKVLLLVPRGVSSGGFSPGPFNLFDPNGDVSGLLTSLSEASGGNRENEDNE